MISDLQRLLEANPPDTAPEKYRISIFEDNVLGKRTSSTRLWSWWKLRALYGLDPRLAVFRCFRQLWDSDSRGRPILALLCACARDPLLRVSSSVILMAPIDSVVTSEDFMRHIKEATPDRFKATTLRSMSRNLVSTWTQSGYLREGKVRRRAHPIITPEATAYALVLGRLAGVRGQLLFTTLWAALLDTSTERLYELAALASQRGCIDLRRAGTVVDVGFSKLLTEDERGAP